MLRLKPVAGCTHVASLYRAPHVAVPNAPPLVFLIVNVIVCPSYIEYRGLVIVKAVLLVAVIVKNSYVLSTAIEAL